MAADGLRGKTGEEIVCDPSGCTVDQALTDLGQLAADCGSCRIGEHSTGVAGRKYNFGLAAAEPRGTATSLAPEKATMRRVQFALFDCGLECRFDRANPECRDRIEVALVASRKPFASGNAGLQDQRVVERRPYTFRRGWNLISSGKVHRPVSVISLRRKELQTPVAIGKDSVEGLRFRFPLRDNHVKLFDNPV
jgi:hypothetical protein